MSIARLFKVQSYTCVTESIIVNFVIFEASKNRPLLLLKLQKSTFVTFVASQEQIEASVFDIFDLNGMPYNRVL